MYTDTNMNYKKYLKYKYKYLTHKYFELINILDQINIKQSGGGIIYPMPQIRLIPNYIANIELIDDILRVYYLNGTTKDLKLNINRINIDNSVIDNQLKDIVQDKLNNITDQIKAINEKINSTNNNLGTTNIEVGQVKQDVGQVKQDVGQVKQDVGQVKQDVGQVKQDVGQVNIKINNVKKDVTDTKGNVDTQLQNFSKRKVIKEIRYSE